MPLWHALTTSALSHTDALVLAVAGLAAIIGMRVIVIRHRSQRE